MVQISSPGGKSREEVQDDIGAALVDGLEYLDGPGEINVSTGQNVQISGSGNVEVADAAITEKALAFDIVEV